MAVPRDEQQAAVTTVMVTNVGLGVEERHPEGEALRLDGRVRIG